MMVEFGVGIPWDISVLNHIVLYEVCFQFWSNPFANIKNPFKQHCLVVFFRWKKLDFSLEVLIWKTLKLAQ